MAARNSTSTSRKPIVFGHFDRCESRRHVRSRPGSFYREGMSHRRIHGGSHARTAVVDVGPSVVEPDAALRCLTGALSSDPRCSPCRVALRRHVNRRQVDRFDGRPDHDWWGHVSYVEPDPLRWRVSLSLFR